MGRAAAVGGGVSAPEDGALDVFHRDRAVLVVVDLQQKLLPGIAEKKLRRMEHAGAVLSSTEMAVYELLGRSDGTAFKRLLPYLK